MSRAIRVMSATPHHPDRGATSFVHLNLELAYLVSKPIEEVGLSAHVARLLAEELLVAARIVDNANERRSRG